MSRMWTDWTPSHARDAGHSIMPFKVARATSSVNRVDWSVSSARAYADAGTCNWTGPDSGMMRRLLLLSMWEWGTAIRQAIW
jgi:hypothetical protein